MIRRVLGTVAAAVLASTAGLGPASAAPPEPTEQRARCAVAVPAASRSAPAGHRLLDLTAAHRFSTGAGVTVGVIDTGVDPHPRLPALVAGGDLVSDGDGLSDCDAHGTLVAGIIAARPSPDDDFVGVAPDATVVSIRQSSGAFSAVRRDRDAAVVGAGYGPVSTLATAIDRATELGARVVNISEVACTAPGDTVGDAALTAALIRARRRDAVVVVAAGNLTESTACREQNPAGTAPPGTTGTLKTSVTPARLAPLVLTVGAVDETGAPAEFSLRGPWVGVAAPGTDVVSLAPGPRGPHLVDGLRTTGGTAPLAGTSYAAPYVAGLAALIRARYPRASAPEVIAQIVNTAHGGGPDASVGSGVVDPVAALATEPPPIREPGATSDRPFALPAPAPPADSGAPLVVAGLGAAVAVLAGRWLVSRRRATR